MHRRSRLLTAVLTAATVVASLAVADAAVAARPPAIAWEPCPEDPTAQCGTVRVPIDWSRPGGDTFELALARRPATDPAARIGSLQINPGGPGGSGRLFAIFGADDFSEEIRRRFDIVGIDPRGVGLSSPVMCSSAVLAQEPSPLLTSQADFDARLAYNARLRADCRLFTGPLFDHVDMRSVVRDMDYVRAALGDEKLTYSGVLLRVDERPAVRRDVPAPGPGHRVGQQPRPQPRHPRVPGHRGGQRPGLVRRVRGVVRPDAGQRPARPDVREVWHDLLARAERGEIPFPPDPSRPLTPDDLINLAFGAFYGPDWAILAEVLSDLDTDTPIPVEPEEPGPGEPELVPFPPLAIFCNDWSLPVRDYREAAAHLRRLGRIAPDMRYSPASTLADGGVPGLAGPDRQPAAPAAGTRRRHALLLVNALHDPATGYNRALGVARQLGREGRAAHVRRAGATGSTAAPGASPTSSTAT